MDCIIHHITLTVDVICCLLCACRLSVNICTFGKRALITLNLDSCLIYQIYRPVRRGGGGGSIEPPKLASYHAYIYTLTSAPGIPTCPMASTKRAREDELQSEVNITKYFRVADPTMMGGDIPSPTDRHINNVSHNKSQDINAAGPSRQTGPITE